MPSSNAQCTTCVPCEVYDVGSFVVPVIVPAQLSVVVGALAAAEHSPVASASVETTGASLSLTVTVNEQLEVPHALEAVAVTAVVPTGKKLPEAFEYDMAGEVPKPTAFG